MAGCRRIAAALVLGVAVRAWAAEPVLTPETCPPALLLVATAAGEQHLGAGDVVHVRPVA